MTPAAFARALAATVAASLPDGFSASAEGEQVTIHAPDGEAVTTTLDLDAQETTDHDACADAAEGVLSLVQDVVCEALDTPWPTGSAFDLPIPGASAGGGVLRLWYGEEDAPVLTLGDITLT